MSVFPVCVREDTCLHVHMCVLCRRVTRKGLRTVPTAIENEAAKVGWEVGWEMGTRHTGHALLLGVFLALFFTPFNYSPVR